MAAEGCRGNALEEWENETLRPLLRRYPPKKREFRLRDSKIPIEWLYTPRDVTADYESKIGFPGRPPFTRGVYPSMYRGRMWTIRQYAGYASPRETNRLFKN
ncbi:MAG: methylmalonyl-CoA mutase family protein, partial [bacterium]